MDLIDKFTLIRSWYEKQDARVRKREGKPFFRTEHGLWGAADLTDMFEFFLKNEMDDLRFADYGSGDGRIVLLAALFCPATGIEGDAELVAVSERAKKELLKEIPELERATFKTSNYYAEQHEQYDVLFFFADHPFPESFERDLLKSFTGTLLVYNDIHRPELIKKGKTYWVRQMPIVSYPLSSESVSFSTNQN